MSESYSMVEIGAGLSNLSVGISWEAFAPGQSSLFIDSFPSGAWHLYQASAQNINDYIQTLKILLKNTLSDVVFDDRAPVLS